jgi:hypothetical protein
MVGRTLDGIERDRAIIRGAALNIIRQVLEKPAFDKSKDTRRDWLAPPPLSAFVRLEPIGFGLEQDDFWVFHPKDCSPDLVWPLDVGTIVDNCGTAEGGLAIGRCYTVTTKQVRGYAHRFSPFMVRTDWAQMERGQLMRVAGLQAWLGGQWVDAQNRVLWEGRTAEKAIPTRGGGIDVNDAQQVSLHTAIALRQRYEWAVSLGLEESPSIRFATDPTGIKEVFKIRDLPEGRDRREALMNWVSDHWRQDRADPDLEIYVRRHLRGATKFTWRSMNCELLPSTFDMEKRDQLMAERNAMRLEGTDKRAVAR